MRDPIGEVPPGYAVHRVGSTWMVLYGAKSAELVALRLADPSVRKAMFARAPKRGRGKAPSVTLDPQTSMVMRRYRHGGLFGRVSGPLFWGPGRPLNELRVNARAEASGAPVPRVLCLVLWPEFGPFWSAVIGTQEERLARELQEVLLASPAPARIALARGTGSAIRRLHDSGVEHRDLQLRNILVAENGGPRIVVVDLDRAQFHRYGLVPIAGRARNLGRLARSAVKLGLWGGAVGRRELAAFAGAYTAGKRTLRRELRTRIPVERLKLLAHRVSYPLRGAATRDPGSGSDRPGPAPGS